MRLYRSGLTSTSYTSGIIQIYYSNTWGNICDDSDFAYNEANVICHQLGYSGYSSYGSSGTLSRFVNTKYTSSLLSYCLSFKSVKSCINF